MLNPSSLESILVKSVSMEVRSAESLALSRLPWLTVSRSLPSGGEIRGGGEDLNLSSQHSANARLRSPGSSFFHQRKKKKITFSHELFLSCVDALQPRVSSQSLTRHDSIELGVGPKRELMSHIRSQTCALEEKSPFCV